jgi:hypothetical protein
MDELEAALTRHLNGDMSDPLRDALTSAFHEALFLGACLNRGRVL